MDDSVIYIAAVALPLLLLLVAAIADIYARPDLSWAKRLLWTAVVILLPYIGVAAYYITRPLRQPEGKKYGDEVPRTDATVDHLEALKERHESGDLDDEGYLAAKRSALGLEDETADPAS